MGIDINKAREDEKRKSLASNFYHNYTGNNTIGECLDAASRYAKLFD